MNESINICSAILCLCFYDGYTFEMAIVVLGTNKLVFYIMQSLIYKDLSAQETIFMDTIGFFY